MFSTKSEISGRTVHAFCIYDSKGETYNPPFFFKAKGEAIRAFTELVNDQQSSIYKYPEDYTLFHIGTFNPDDAKLEALRTPMSLGVALEYKQQQSPQPRQPQGEIFRLPTDTTANTHG